MSNGRKAAKALKKIETLQIRRPPRFDVKQEENDQVPTEVLATAIRDIAQGMRKVNLAGLNRRALTVLVRDATGVSLDHIGRVLNAVEQLEDLYCLKKGARNEQAT